MCNNPAQYFKKYRSKIGFSDQDSARFFLSAKDISKDIDYKYINNLNSRLTDIVKKIATICIHIDIFNGQVAFVKLNNIADNDINWITRQQMNKFCGSKTSKNLQIGNAMPPILAKVIASQIINGIR